MTTVLDQVRAFIARLAPAAVCDDCIADRLDLSVRQNANHKTRELAGSDGFVRAKGPCGLCGADKLVIRKS
jgi:pantothenate kinase